MNNLDNQLKELYQKILAQPLFKTDRTGVGTKSIFGHQMRFNMQDGFPLTTLRKIHTKSMIHEILWFLGSYDEPYKKFGNTNIRYLLDNGVTFWTDWPYKDYRINKINKCKDLKNLKVMSQKEFEKKIMEDDYFALEYGELGPVYGKQWVDWGGHEELIQQPNFYKETKGDKVIMDKGDWKKVYLKGINQINNAIDTLLDDPDSRRIIVNSWNVAEIDDMMLPPCHSFFQFYTHVIPMEERIEYCLKHNNEEEIQKYMVKNGIMGWEEINRFPRKQIKILDHFNVPERKLDLQLYQRSTDSYLGLGYNIAEYSLLLHMVAQVVNMIPNEFIWTGGDTHLYSNSIEAAEELLKREPKELPILKLNPEIQNIYGFRYEDIEIVGYDPHPNIKVDVAV